MTLTPIREVRPEVDLREPRARLRRLFDGAFGVLDDREPAGQRIGVTVGRGEIEGVPAIAYCTDATVMGGALGVAGCRRICDAIDDAVAAGTPVIGLWHSGGARLPDGVGALDAVGRVFAAMVRASGRVPQISAVLGPAAGGAAYGPALTDIVVMSGNGRIFVTGPEVVRSVTGELVDMERLGGSEPHGRRSGVAHVTTEDDAAALQQVRRLTGLLGRPFAGAAPPARPGAAHTGGVESVVAGLLDTAGTELHPRWAPNIVTVLGRLAGRTVGVVANNPRRLGGCLDTAAADKAARFVRMCDSLGLPLVVIVDAPGFLPGLHEEWRGSVRHAGKLLHAFAEAVVPRVTLITGRAYGAAYHAMNSRALGATAVFAWPGADVAMMRADAAAGFLHRRRLAGTPAAERGQLRSRLAREYADTVGGLARALEIGAVDAVIAPAETRARIAGAIAAAATARGAHRNIPL